MPDEALVQPAAPAVEPTPPPVQEPATQETPAATTQPAPAPAVTETDPWEGLSENDRIRAAREHWRTLDPKTRKMAQQMMTLNTQERLDRDRQSRAGLKYTEEDLARIKSEVESQYKPLVQQSDAEKAFEESIKDYADETKEALRLQNKHWKTIFESTVKPLQDKLTAIETPLQRAEENAKIEGIVRAVVAQTPAPEGLILHLIEANKTLPQDEQAQTPDDFTRAAEVIMDDWGGHFIPKRVEAEDKPTLDLFKNQFFKALDANKPWANEIRNAVIEKYTGTKVPGEPGTEKREEPQQPAEPIPWDPRKAALGR